jgi:hypothetical protein
LKFAKQPFSGPLKLTKFIFPSLGCSTIKLYEMIRTGFFFLLNKKQHAAVIAVKLAETSDMIYSTKPLINSNIRAKTYLTVKAKS